MIEDYIRIMNTDPSHYDHDPSDISEEEFALYELKKFSHIAGRTKIDKTMRISLISEIAGILDARPGEEIEYEVSNLEIKIRKITTPLKGYDIGRDIIKENTVEYAAKKKMCMEEELERERKMGETISEGYDEIRNLYLELRTPKRP